MSSMRQKPSIYGLYWREIPLMKRSTRFWSRILYRRPSRQKTLWKALDPESYWLVGLTVGDGAAAGAGVAFVVSIRIFHPPLPLGPCPGGTLVPSVFAPKLETSFLL